MNCSSLAEVIVDRVRGTWPRRSIAAPVAALTSALVLLAGCGDTSITDAASDLVASPNAQSAPRVAVVAHPGLNPQNVAKQVGTIIDTQIEERGSLDIRVMGQDGSAATMMQLDVGVNGAVGGNKGTTDENEQAREGYRRDAVAQLDEAMTSEVDTEAPADLLEALARAVGAAENLDGSGQKRAVLVTGGGVHRSPGLDFYGEVDPGAQGDAVATVAERIGKADVHIEIIGVAQLAEGTNPDPALTERVNQLWHEVCAALEGQVTSCAVRN